MAPFRLSLVLDIGFSSIGFEGMHRFYQKYAEGNIIVK